MRNAYTFSWKTGTEEMTMGDLGVYRRIILKWTLKG
jgi:hypothetical protein